MCLAKMTCWKCRQHFCYRCGQKLNANQPYAHFSIPGSCFNKLFDAEEWEMEFEEIDDEEQDI
jgi:E3 ubiquitin-protein ligase RNF14